MIVLCWQTNQINQVFPMLNMSISVVFVIKNAITQGYCFWESLQSCLPFADEIIISEGYSDDYTYYNVCRFKEQCNIPITIFRDRWEEKSYCGEVIAKVSSRAIELANCEWVYLLQADEIIHENTAAQIGDLSRDGYNSISFPFYHFIRSWEPYSTPAYRSAIRMVKRNEVKIRGDAWSFEPVESVCPSENIVKPIYHFAWVFPVQNNAKDIEHYKMYQNVPEYKEKMHKALNNRNLESYPRSNFDDFPRLARRFVGLSEYTLP